MSNILCEMCTFLVTILLVYCAGLDPFSHLKFYCLFPLSYLLCIFILVIELPYLLHPRAIDSMGELVLDAR